MSLSNVLFLLDAFRPFSFHFKWFPGTLHYSYTKSHVCIILRSIYISPRSSCYFIVFVCLHFFLHFLLPLFRPPSQHIHLLNESSFREMRFFAELSSTNECRICNFQVQAHKSYIEKYIHAYICI